MKISDKGKVLIKSEEYKRYIQTIKKSSPKSETK